MPLYDFKCMKCKKSFEKYLPLKKWDSRPECPFCGGETLKQLTIKRGGTQDDHPVWLNDSVRMQIQDTDNPNIPPIETRTEYKQHLEDTGIVEKS